MALDRQGRARAAASGLADVAAATPLTNAARFHMCSITKAFTAGAALKLVDQGRLSLAATLTDSAADIASEIPNADRITVGQLLDHSSGIYAPNNDPAYLQQVIGENADPSHVIPPEEIIAIAARGEPLGEPGQGHWYSDTNYILLGILIARASGQDFRAFVKDQILTPLALDQTSFYSERLPEGGLGSVETMHGYFYMPDETRAALAEAQLSLGSQFAQTPGLIYQGAPYYDTTLAVERVDAAAGMITTLADLTAFGRALFDGQLVSASSQALLAPFDDLGAAPLDETRTRALRAVRKSYGGVIYAAGDSPGGFNTVLAFHPESGTVIACVINTFGHFDELDWMIDTIIPAALSAS
jgi:D-alanyl-D-alanine carboxypeptidase